MRISDWSSECALPILNAARQIGGELVPPAMCYYSSLEGSGGKCRTCLVKVSKGSEKDPRPMPKLVASCRTGVMDGMEVQNITSPEVLEARKGIVEFLRSEERRVGKECGSTFGSRWSLYH